MKDRLIVALDGDAAEMGAVFARLNRELGLQWFKINADMLIQHSGRILMDNMLRDGARLFLDLKLYDTPDSVERITRRVFENGVEMLTVYATPSIVEAAMRGKKSHDNLVIGVEMLTSSLYDMDDWRNIEDALTGTDGAIMLGWLLTKGWVHEDLSSLAYGKILVAPGIRPAWHPELNNHRFSLTPKHALSLGADYIVVGRPITQAADPVVAARAILDEMTLSER